MPGLAEFKFIEWPAMRAQLVGVFMLIFTLCFTSFTIVMTLGGGPRAATVEVAIYQALRFDFDLNAAVSLAIAQLVFCTALLLASTLFKQNSTMGFAYKPAGHQFRPTSTHRWLNALLIVSGALFVIAPLSGLAISAINPVSLNVLMHANTLKAVVNTVIIALVTSVLSVSISISLLIRLTIIINSLMALPIVLRILDGPLMQAAEHHDRLIQSLGISGWSRWRLLDWPLIRKPIGFSLGIAATLAAGDFSAIALFGSERALTLPLLLFQRIGSYRLHEAATTAGILLLVCLILFIVLQSVSTRNFLGSMHAED